MPAEVSRLEGQLKKIWNKIEKDRRGGQGSIPTADGAKRKRNQGDEAGRHEPKKKSKATMTKKQPAEAETQAKVTKSPKAAATPKAKASTTSTKESKPKTPKPASKDTKAEPSEPGSNVVQDVSFKATNHPRKKQTARCSGRGGAFLSSGRVTPSESFMLPIPSNHPIPKNHARRSKPIPQPGRGTSSNSIPETIINRPRTKQTVRRSKPFLHQGRGVFVGTVNSRTPDSWDDEQAEDGETDDDSDVEHTDEGYTNDDGDVEMIDVVSPPRNYTSLGFINGTYEIDCPDLEEWTWTSDDFSLILCLDGDSVWGAYDFGMFSGIMHLRQRPYAASDEQLPIQWRGRENSEGQMSFGSGNDGWIRFDGGGRISGMINCHGNVIFRGVRISGNETRSERSLRSMQQEWDGYNQREYDRENRARWGGSGW